jgi:hypothetical protein
VYNNVLYFFQPNGTSCYLYAKLEQVGNRSLVQHTPDIKSIRKATDDDVTAFYAQPTGEPPLEARDLLAAGIKPGMSARFKALNRLHFESEEGHAGRREHAVTSIATTVWKELESRVTSIHREPAAVLAFGKYVYPTIGDGLVPLVIYPSDYTLACVRLAQEAPEMTWSTLDMHAINGCSCSEKERAVGMACNTFAIRAKWTWDPRANAEEEEHDLT